MRPRTRPEAIAPPQAPARPHVSPERSSMRLFTGGNFILPPRRYKHVAPDGAWLGRLPLEGRTGTISGLFSVACYHCWPIMSGIGRGHIRISLLQSWGRSAANGRWQRARSADSACVIDLQIRISAPGIHEAFTTTGAGGFGVREPGGEKVPSISVGGVTHVTRGDAGET